MCGSVHDGRKAEKKEGMQTGVTHIAVISWEADAGGLVVSGLLRLESAFKHKISSLVRHYLKVKLEVGHVTWINGGGMLA